MDGRGDWVGRSGLLVHWGSAAAGGGLRAAVGGRTLVIAGLKSSSAADMMPLCRSRETLRGLKPTAPFEETTRRGFWQSRYGASTPMTASAVAVPSVRQGRPSLAAATSPARAGVIPPDGRRDEDGSGPA